MVRKLHYARSQILISISGRCRPPNGRGHRSTFYQKKYEGTCCCIGDQTAWYSFIIVKIDSDYLCVITMCMFGYLQCIEASGPEGNLELLRKEILEAGILYMKKNWHIWCQRLSVSNAIAGEYPNAIKGEMNRDDDCK